MKSAADRLHLADEAIVLCRKVQQYNPLINKTSKEVLQAEAIIKLARLDRADMSFFRCLLGMERADFAQCLATARVIRRTGKSAIRLADPTPVLTLVIEKALAEVAK